MQTPSLVSLPHKSVAVAEPERLDHGSLGGEFSF